MHSNFVLLAFFLGADEKIKKFLKDKLYIEDIESVLFVLNKPDWKGSSKGDPRFWNATGVVRPFLNRLYDASLAPMKKTFTLPDPMKKTKKHCLCQENFNSRGGMNWRKGLVCSFFLSSSQDHGFTMCLTQRTTMILLVIN